METITIPLEEYKNLKLWAAQLDFALDMIPNLDDVIEQFKYEEEDE